ncbi:MAG: TolC family protein [Acidobacteriota bacterium]
MALGLCAAWLAWGGELRAQAGVAVEAAAPPAKQTISMDDAVRLAQKNEIGFVTANAQQKTAQLDSAIARAGLLPTVTYHNQYLFTQGNGSNDRIGQTVTSSAPRFIANNAVHEYASQAVVNETLGLQQFTAAAVAQANAAKAMAEAEIARRGLFATVAGLYYGLAASQAKLAALQRGLDEANNFLKLTKQREDAREAAHADVVKAELQQQQRVRDVQDAKLAAAKARLELGVLLFADPRTEFETVTATTPPMLPDRATMEADAAKNDVEMKSALAAVRASEAGVSAARAAYFPDLALNYTYGIDAPQFAVNGPDGTRNLGYAASATLDIPVWDWFATAHKVKQSEIQRDVAKVTLTVTQRRLVANFQEYYDEASTARDQLASLDASVATAKESLHLTQLRYTGGDGTVFEVVDAQNALIAAETAQADGVTRYEVALANLQTLTGKF